MKKRNVFLMLVVFVLGMFAVCFSAKNVKAMEIAEDGEYTLVLSTTGMKMNILMEKFLK